MCCVNLLNVIREPHMFQNPRGLLWEFYLIGTPCDKAKLFSWQLMHGSHMNWETWKMGKHFPVEF